MLLLTALCALTCAAQLPVLARARTTELPATISIVHVNDIHAHLDEFDEYGTDCDTARRALERLPQDHGDSDKPAKSAGLLCQGGYARIAHAIAQIRERYPGEVLLLNAGDEAQGTMFYTYYKGEVGAKVLNALDFDALTVGNHEFDDGSAHFTQYLRNLTAPVVGANVVHAAGGSLWEGLVRYHLVERLGVAVIGLVTQDTQKLSSPGKEVAFLDPEAVVQDLVDEVRGKGYKRVILLTHIGYGLDQQIARATNGVSAIVGGHSHTFLGDVPGSEGPYPTIVQDANGFDVPVVTTGKWGFNLGHLRVTFDADGHVEHHEAKMLSLSNNLRQDHKLQQQIKAWKLPFLEFAREVVGRAAGPFSQTACQVTECSVGNLVAEAMYDAHSNADVALMNAGGLRAGIPKGNITRGGVLTVLPFSSRLVDLQFSGYKLQQILEGIVSWQNVVTDHDITSFVQVAGVRITYKSSRPKGKRIERIDIRDRRTGSFAALESENNYTVCTLDFMAEGGDFWWPEVPDYERAETVDDALIKYLAKLPDNLAIPVLDGRIKDTTLVVGHVKQHAEHILHWYERIVFAVMSLFGPFGYTDAHATQLVDRFSAGLLGHFEGGDFR
ncbi:hypothetical protein PYCC9005_000722 [Savitreella phatthalungensis]